MRRIILTYFTSCKRINYTDKLRLTDATVSGALRLAPGIVSWNNGTRSKTLESGHSHIGAKRPSLVDSTQYTCRVEGGTF